MVGKSYQKSLTLWFALEKGQQSDKIHNLLKYGKW